MPGTNDANNDDLEGTGANWEGLVDNAQNIDLASPRYRSRYFKSNTVLRSTAPQDRAEDLLHLDIDKNDLLRTDTSAAAREEAMRLCMAYRHQLSEASQHLAELAIALGEYEPELRWEKFQGLPKAGSVDKVLHEAGKASPAQLHRRGAVSKQSSTEQVLGPLMLEATKLDLVLQQICYDPTDFADYVRTSAGRKQQGGKDIGVASELEPLIDQVSTLLDLSSVVFDAGLARIGGSATEAAQPVADKDARFARVQAAVSAVKGVMPQLHKFMHDLKEVEIDATTMKLGGKKAEDVMKRIGLQQRKGGIGIAGPSAPAAPGLPAPKEK